MNDSILFGGLGLYGYSSGNQPVITFGLESVNLPSLTTYEVEWTKWWPRWMDIRNPGSSGTLLKRFLFSSIIDAYVDFRRDLDDYIGGRLYSSWGQQRLGWVTYTSLKQSNEVSIVLFVAGSSGSVRRAKTPFEFAHATDPVFILDSNGAIYFRNIEVLEKVVTSPVGFSYTVGALVQDSDVWFKQGDVYERIPSHSSKLNQTTGQIYFPREVPTTIRYSSASRYTLIAASGLISINGGPLTSISEIRFDNCWDSHGFVRDLIRLPLEDNYSYYTRQKSCYYIKGGTPLQKVASGAARHLGMINSVTWAATGSIAFNASEQITYISIYPLNNHYTITERPQKIGDNIYRLSRVPEDGLLQVFINNQTVSASILLDNTLVFPTVFNDPITVTYTYKTYNVVKNSDGYIVSVSPVSSNVDTNVLYSIYYVRGIKNYNLSDDIPELYSPSGAGTEYLKQLANVVETKVQVTLGTIAWGRGLWFNETDVKPQILYVPRVLE